MRDNRAQCTTVERCAPDPGPDPSAIDRSTIRSSGTAAQDRSDLVDGTKRSRGGSEPDRAPATVGLYRRAPTEASD